ncbi:uncharacterized protein AruCF_0206 [Achromobacter ruhlandii]|nr:uncharacterized protein AruCF_0206 [Achromobacter ruhlandii]
MGGGGKHQGGAAGSGQGKGAQAPRHREHFPLSVYCVNAGIQVRRGGKSGP